MFTYHSEAPVALQDKHSKGRDQERAAKGTSADLPRDLALSGSWVDPLHDADNVKGRCYVEYFEYKVPC